MKIQSLWSHQRRLILTVALATVLFVNIFLFKHRMLQFRICIFALLAECLIIFLYFRQIKNYSNGNFSLWCALHVFILAFIIFAAIGIYKDEKLIKDSNRLSGGILPGFRDEIILRSQ